MTDGGTSGQAPRPQPKRAVSFDELLRPDVNRSLRRLPRLVGDAVRLVWDADRPDLLLVAAVQLLGGAVLAGQLLVGRVVLGDLVVAARATAPAGPGAPTGATPTPAPPALDTLGALLPGLAALAVLTAIGMFLTALSGERQRVLAERVSKAAFDRIIDAATAVPLAEYESPTYHDQFQRALTNAQIRPWSITQGLLGLGSSLTTGAGVAVALAAIEPLFIVVLAAGVVPLWLVNRANSRASYRFAFTQTADDRRRFSLQLALTGKESAKEVRVYRLARFLRGRFDELWQRRFVELERLARLRLRRSVLAGVAYALVLAGAIVGLVWLVLGDRISLADAGVAAVAVQQLGTQLRTTISSVGNLYESTLFLEDVTTFLALAPAPAADSGERAGDTADRVTEARPAAPRRFDTLTVDRVSFTYPGTTTEVLHDVSFAVESGTVVALVGENGSGKTTLAKLLCHLYEPTAGHIRWDGTDTTDFDPSTVRDRVAVIFQDFVQYELAAFENIGVGDTARMDDRPAIEAAAGIVGAHEFLAALDDGYETMLGRAFLGGAELSVGQWQRVALARALFADRPLLVLDEPTAALDARAEADLFAAIGTLAAGRTVLLISHRFSSVRSADHILVLHEGNLIEQGTHGQLMALAGHYAELFTLQARSYTDGP